MESVYIETTICSYLVARPSRDIIVASHQQITQEWWNQRRPLFECSVSQVVIDEISQGDPTEIQKRLAIVDSLLVLSGTTQAEVLTQEILDKGILPDFAARDAAHVAIAAIHNIDYLLTWNCKHLANAQIMRRIEVLCSRLGYRMPIICTPEELMGV